MSFWCPFLPLTTANMKRKFGFVSIKNEGVIFARECMHVERMWTLQLKQLDDMIFEKNYVIKQI